MTDARHHLEEAAAGFEPPNGALDRVLDGARRRHRRRRVLGAAFALLIGLAGLAVAVSAFLGSGPAPSHTPTPRPPATRTPGVTAGRVGLDAIHMIDARVGWALEEDRRGNAALLRTDDGGVSWIDVSPLGFSWTSSSFSLDADHAWVVVPVGKQRGYAYRKAAVVRTPDGGRTWQRGQVIRLRPGAEEDVVAFTDPLNGWLVANACCAIYHDWIIVYRSSDGGETWTRVNETRPGSSPGSGLALELAGCDLTAFVFTTTDTGFASGDGANGACLFVTRDGGRTWPGQDLPPAASCDCGGTETAPEFPTTRDGFMLAEVDGPILLVTHDGAASWQALPVLVPIEGGQLGSIDFVDPLRGFLVVGVGQRSSLYGTTDGGHSWDLLETGQELMSVEFVTPDLGWGRVGTWGGPAVTTDGGRTWRQLPLEISPGPTEATPPTTTIGETLVDDAHTPQAHVVPMTEPVDIGAVGSEGQELIVQPATPGPEVVSAQEAVDEAWRHNGDLHPSSVTAEFGILEGYPEWLVVFDGVCLIGPGRTVPPGEPQPAPSCSTRVTARIDGATGKWVESFG